jgi:hypothetical protein
MRYGTGHLGYTVPTCAAESLPHSGQCPLGVVYVSGSEKDTQAGLLYVTETGRCGGPPLAEIYRTRVALHAWPRAARIGKWRGVWLVYDNTQWAVSLGGGICLWVCEKTTEIRLNKQAPGRPESGNGGVCGWCTTTQCPCR